jgi:hypothetical protein
MKFLAQRRLSMKKMILFTVCLGLLSIAFLPGPALALNISSTGTAFIDWSTLSITLDGAAFDPVLDGFGGPSAFSGAQVQLNADQTDFGFADYSDGSFPTSSSASVSDANGSSVTADAQTATDATPGTTTGLSASLTMDLNSPDNSGLSTTVGNQAQATFYDYFFQAPDQFDLDGLLVVTVDYLLTNTLSSDDLLGSITSDVFAGLFLYGYDDFGDPNNDPFVSSTPATAELNNTLTGVGNTGLISSSGTLTLTYNLIAGAFYDLGGEVTATGFGSAPAPAPVPEPATLLLLGTGLAGLGALRKRFKKIMLN